MSSAPRIAALSLLAAAIAGCGDYRLIGRACEGGDCPNTAPVIPPPEGCGAQFRLPTVELPANSELDRCQLFTLDELDAVGAGGQVYLTRAEVETSGSGDHHLDVRIAPEIAGIDEDKPPTCQELWNLMVRWMPLMATQGGSDSWDLSIAPLVTARSHRLLINHHAVNMTDRPVELGVTLNLYCATAPPPRVSQAFEFTDRQRQELDPGDTGMAGGECLFGKKVDVSRLYRRTHLITSYLVERLNPTVTLWSAGPDWTYDFAPPEHFEQGEGVRWECTYRNDSDLRIQIGGDSSDSCSLLGFYQLPDGGEDDSPERCTL